MGMIVRFFTGLALGGVCAAMPGAPGLSTWMSLPYGTTSQGQWLRADMDARLCSVSTPRTRILIVLRTDAGVDESTATLWLERLWEQSGLWQRLFSELVFGIVPFPVSGAQVSATSFPPSGRAYADAAAREAHALWRWIGGTGPDLVVEVVPAHTRAWIVPPATLEKLDFLRRETRLPEERSDSLAYALGRERVAGVGTVPAVVLRAESEHALEPLWEQLQRTPLRSPAREELARRERRSPPGGAQGLAGGYRQGFGGVRHIPAPALIGRLRLGDLKQDAASGRAVRLLLEPYLSGQKPALPARSNGSQQSGHLIFGEMAGRDPDPRWEGFVRAVADLGFEEDGRLREAMPAHAEMSDAVFMGTPLLALSARLTGETKYREMAMRHLRFMVKLNQRPDGLHRHSPVAPDQTAWGRGNGFVALGLALTLSELPEASAEFREVRELYRRHLTAMRRHQDKLGMWHQVVDHPESYSEFSVTCMMTFAMARGLRKGWIDRAEFEPAIQAAWPAINRRIASDGGVIDVCAGTGKMKSLQEYLDRPAILGHDDRGGAMALLLGAELAFAINEGVLALE